MPLSFFQPKRSLGMLLLAIWLILTGLPTFVTIDFSRLPQVMAGLAIAAGVLLLLNR